jgi:hypothetical protein
LADQRRGHGLDGVATRPDQDLRSGGRRIQRCPYPASQQQVFAEHAA